MVNSKDAIQSIPVIIVMIILTGIIGSMINRGFAITQWTIPTSFPQLSLIELVQVVFAGIVIGIIVIFLIIEGWKWYGSFLGGSKSQEQIRREL